MWENYAFYEISAPSAQYVVPQAVNQWKPLEQFFKILHPPIFDNIIYKNFFTGQLICHYKCFQRSP